MMLILLLDRESDLTSNELRNTPSNLTLELANAKLEALAAVDVMRNHFFFIVEAFMTFAFFDAARGAVQTFCQ